VTTVLVVEYLSAGGTVEEDPQASALLLPQGLAMRDAVAADLLRGGARVTVATCAAASRVSAGPTAARSEAGDSLPDFVARLARRHDAVWAIAPETGGCLAAFERAVGRPRWLGCSAEAITLASSKGATLRRLAARGIATPLAFARDGDPGRWVVKPDDGAGAVATRRHASLPAARADVEAQQQAGAVAWIEPWVEGEALSLSLLCRPHGVELLSVNRQHITIDDSGKLSYEGVEIDVLPAADPRRRTLATLAGRVAAAVPGLRGFVGIDLVWHPRWGPVVIEINPRVTCAYVGLPERLGRCLAAEWLAAWRPEAAHA